MTNILVHAAALRPIEVTLNLRQHLAVTSIVMISCARTAPPEAPSAASAPEVSRTVVIGCEPAKPFSGFTTELFLADDRQLQELFNCRFLGLTRETKGSPPPGACSLHDHSSLAIKLPALSMTTIQHLGHVLNSPITDRGPLPDNADFPPATLEYVGATTAPVGTLWLVPPAYLQRLRDVSGGHSADAVGSNLAAHLLEFNPALRETADPAAACTTLVSLLVELAAAASNQRRSLYVLTRADR